jgi:nucleoside 2-deoxyribosyltransferase
MKNIVKTKELLMCNINGKQFETYLESIKIFGKWISDNCKHGFRWHVSGDVMSIEYSKFIVDVCNVSQNVNHWIYTRSLPIIHILNNAKNLTVNISADAENYIYAKQIVESNGNRICYMTSDGSLPEDLPEGSVIFPDYKLRGRDMENPTDHFWWQGLSTEYRKMVCPGDFFGQSEKHRCGVCNKCLYKKIILKIILKYRNKMNKIKKVYLAGPDVFKSNVKEIKDYKLYVLKDYGFEGIFPIDNDEKDLDFSTKYNLGKTIFKSNAEKINCCDIVLANLEPFRGPSADVGTVWECAYGKGLGKIICGYNCDYRVDYKDRIINNRLIPHDGMLIEDFDVWDNIMIVHSLDKLCICKTFEMVVQILKSFIYENRGEKIQ